MGKGDTSTLARRNRAKFDKAIKCGAGVKTKPGLREPNGRPSRSIKARPRERVEKAPTVRARMRDHLLSEAQATTLYGGTGHGRAYLKNVISSEGYQVAEWYVALRAGWQSVHHRGPKEPASAALPYVSMHHGVEDVAAARKRLGRSVQCPEERARRIVEQWNVVQAALMHRNGLLRALNDVSIRGVDVYEARDRYTRNAFLSALEVVAPVWNVAPSDVHPHESS